jgi:hypothetical protein
MRLLNLHARVSLRAYLCIRATLCYGVSVVGVTLACMQALRDILLQDDLSAAVARVKALVR